MSPPSPTSPLPVPLHVENSTRRTAPPRPGRGDGRQATLKRTTLRQLAALADRPARSRRRRPLPYKIGGARAPRPTGGDLVAIKALAGGRKTGGRLKWHSTTVVCVRHGGKVAMASDGQVTLGTTVMKQAAAKMRRLKGGDVIAGFAGSSADAFALFSRFEIEARGAPRQPRALRHRARQGLAHRQDAAPARGPPDRRRQDDVAPDLRHRRPDLARRGNPRRRLGRPLRARRRPRSLEAPRRT